MLTRLFVLLIVFAFATFGCSIDDSKLKVGMIAPSLQTKTLADVGGDFSRITTYRYPDKRMYQVSLDQALNANKPIVLEFATPGHCTVCDKQLQMLKAVMNKYEDNVIFIHLDQYQNPEAFKIFGIIGDPWTYVIDTQKKVHYKQAGRMLYSEMDLVLKTIMGTINAADQRKSVKSNNG